MLTVIILAFNEAENLKKLLPSLALADRVLVVVDDKTSDDTVEVARKCGARVIEYPVGDDFAAARNYALKQVRTKWSLFLDADERLSTKSQQIISSETKKNDAKTAYSLKREDIFLDKRLRFGETRDVWLTRLVQTKAGRNRWQRAVHEVWEIDEVVQLQEVVIEHQAHETLGGFLSDITTYAKKEALYRCASDRKFSWLEWFKPIGKFFYNLVLKRGIVDGWRGVVHALGMSWHSVLVRWFQMRMELKDTKIDGRFLFEGFIWGVVGLAVLGQLQRVVVPAQNVAVLGFEGVMVLCILLGGWLWYRERKKLKLNRLLLAFVVWLLVLFLSWVSASVREQLILWGPLLYLVRLVLYGGFFVVVYVGFKKDWIRVTAQRMLTVMGGGLLLTGFFQYFLQPDLRQLVYFGWDDHFFRMVGSVLDPNYFGVLLALSLLLWLSWQPARWGWVLLTMVGVALTYSRSAYFALVVGLFYLAWQSPRYRKLVAGLFLGLLVTLGGLSLWFNPGGEGVNLLRTYSVVSRARSVLTGWQLFQEEPVMGVGFNAYRYMTSQSLDELPLPYHPSAPDSSLMLLLATTGWVGMGAFGWFVVHLWRSMQRSWVKASLLVVAVHMMTNNTLFYPWVMVWVGFLVVGELVRNRDVYGV